MHSVMCDMNRNPQVVRVHAATDAELVVDRQLFSNAVSQYYDGLLRLSVNDLKQLASRKIGYNGTSHSLGDGTIIKLSINNTIQILKMQY